MSKLKGTIVIGAPRSGSHMTCDMLFNVSNKTNKLQLGEVSSPPNIPNQYPYCSIVRYSVKNLLAVNTNWTNDYEIINLRRKDKVAQYISWCVFRTQTQSSIYKHSPNWDDYKNLLPWQSTIEDIEMFIIEQNLDFAIPADKIFYYEEIVKSNMPTQYTKNNYPIPIEQIVTDYALVKKMLENYSYNGR